MALQLPERRPPPPPQPTQYAPVPMNQIISVMGQNPYAQAIDQITPVIAQALQQRAQRKRQAQATGAAAQALGITMPEGTDTSGLTPENLINIKKENEAGQDTFTGFGLTPDKLNIIAMNKRGETKLLPIPGYAPKNQPAPPIPKPIDQNHEEDQWVKLGDKVNNLRQSSRSTVGAAAIANQRADRALQVLGDTGASPQQLDYAMTDLAAIFQNGSPHETALNRQQYSTLKSKFLNLKTYLTANPSAANQPEIQKQLTDTVKEIKNVDNKIVSDNLGIEGIAFEGLIKRNPDRWQRMMSAVNATTGGASDMTPLPAGAPALSPLGDPKAQGLRNKYGY